MLSSTIFNPRNMDELLQEAHMQIPLIGDEWTNFNPSDPASTILESLSQLTLMQEKTILMLPDRVQERLFAMAGFTRLGAKSARVLLKARNVAENITIPMGQKFFVGDMCFESGKEQVVSNRYISAIYTGTESKLKDISYILDPAMPIKASIFGKKPQADMQLYLVCNELGKAGEELLFYLKLEEPYMRNPVEEGQPFSEIEWECYTDKGFVPVKVTDHTDGFLRSGEIRFKLPRHKAAIYDGLEKKGYVLRATLKKAAYDIPPKLLEATGFLMEVWQKDTEALCYTFEGKKSIEVFSKMAGLGYFTLFVKEEGQEHYRRYQPGDPSLGRQGRYYTLKEKGDYRYSFTFDAGYGYEPADAPNAIKFVAYNEETMPRFRLGTIYGYENQTMELPLPHMVKESFSLIARRIDENGEEIFDFIKPDSTKDDEFAYTILDEENQLKILDPKDYCGAELLLCTCAKLAGEMGNIRGGVTFIPEGMEGDIHFTNPSPGMGGRLGETLAELRQRFIRDLSDRYTAVEVEDYEKIVMTTPGLCIHKVRAIMDKKQNQVQIAVKPYGIDEKPVLSEVYEKAIRARLEERRLLTTNIAILQPEYVPVSVRGLIYVKSHYGAAVEKIEAVIRHNLDYIGTERRFGETLSFDKLFHTIEQLDCVDFIYELDIHSGNSALAVRQGMDIVPAPQVLLYPGDIEVEINSLDQ